MKFKADQDKAAADKLKGAKTDADRETILKDYRKTLDDKQNADAQADGRHDAQPRSPTSRRRKA